MFLNFDICYNKNQLVKYTVIIYNVKFHFCNILVFKKKKNIIICNHKKVKQNSDILIPITLQHDVVAFDI